MSPPAQCTLDTLELLADAPEGLALFVLAAAAEVTACWPVREHHRRNPPADASQPTTELTHAV